ncbi:MAG TPA: multiprotein bridging factor aMBF1 [Candidatus Thermoplasmatota archaeon]|nr:multiprotein bridging factor aMBF1 [Candidatus Thermoplasmatota archaeon]
MQCEMCGKDFPSLRRAIVEGALINVCGGCVRFGVEQVGHQAEVTGKSKVVEAIQSRQTRMKARDIYNEMEEALVEDYVTLIRQARTRRGLTPEQLSEKLSEKRSTIAHVESGQLHPSDLLVKKLEKELGIKLMEKPEYALGTQKKDVGKAVTLGDLIKNELDKNKKQR